MSDEYRQHDAAKKDYTSTIMRMAGNIASGMTDRHITGEMEHDNRAKRYIAMISVSIAQQIVACVLANAEINKP